MMKPSPIRATICLSIFGLLAACSAEPESADLTGDEQAFDVATSEEATESAGANEAGSLSPPAAVDEGSVRRIVFDRGANSAVTEGSVTGYNFIDYTLNVRAGQNLNISMATDNSSNYFNVLEPGEADAAVFVGSTSGDQFEGTAAKSGDYGIRVYLMRNAARRDETANFRLETIVSGSARAGNQPAGDFIRGPGGIEEKCIARVNEITGGNARGTNRISESEAAIEIYVNVSGADAPWRCLGYRDRTIGEPMYMGSEGAL